MSPKNDSWLVALVTMAAAAGVAGGVLYWAIDKIEYANGRLVSEERENDALRAEHERIRASYHGLMDQLETYEARADLGILHIGLQKRASLLLECEETKHEPRVVFVTKNSEWLVECSTSRELVPEPVTKRDAVEKRLKGAK